MARTLGLELGEFLQGLARQELPANLYQAASDCILDAIAAMAVGWHEGYHLPLMKAMAFAPGHSSVLTEKGTYSPHYAATVNTFLVTASVFEDGSRHAGLHPSAAIVPTALALGEDLGLSGRQVLAGVIGGYEIIIRLGRELNPSALYKGFHLTGILAAVGTAACAAVLLGLDQQQAAAALNIAAPLGSGLHKAFSGPDTQPLHVARSAESGIIAAFLAREDARGYERMLEESLLPVYGAAENIQVLSGLGTEFMIHQIYRKPYPGCRHVHPALDAALKLYKERGIRVDQVESVLVETYTAALKGEVEEPKQRHEAYFSIPYAVGVAFTYGDAAWERFDDQLIQSERMQEFMTRVRIEARPDMDRLYPQQRGAKVCVRLKDGATYTADVENALGEPEMPLERDAICSKLHQALRGTPLEKKAEQIALVAGRTPGLANIKELTGLMRSE